MGRSFEVEPSQNGWQLKLLVNGEEVAGGSFPEGDEGRSDAVIVGESFVEEAA